MIQLSEEQLNNLNKDALVIIVSSLQDQLASMQDQLEILNENMEKLIEQNDISYTSDWGAQFTVSQFYAEKITGSPQTINATTHASDFKISFTTLLSIG